MFMLVLSCIGMIVCDWFSFLSSVFLLSFLFMLKMVSASSYSLLGGWFFSSNLNSSLILLSLWIVGLMVMASSGILRSNNFVSIFLKVSLMLLVSLVFSFAFQNYMGFYFSFEVSLLPTLLLILGWGYQPERMQAGVYMLFYTLFGSMPLLVFLFKSFYYSSSSMLINHLEMSSVAVMWGVAGVVAFFMKLPVYYMHLWLPKAHVEAPIAGSMILAGVLLKLGGYGLIVVSVWVASSLVSLLPFCMSLGLLGGALVGVMCVRQTDMKSLIAYSSVAHMGLVLGGILVFNAYGFNGGLEVILGHGLCSSGMFFLANSLYERSNSRSLYISKGGLTLFPSMSLWWFLLCVSNMAAPPTLNLLGEVSLFVSLIGWSEMTWFSLALISFFSGAYSLYLFSRTQHGVSMTTASAMTNGVVSEFMVLMLHWLPLNLVVLKSGFVLFGSFL